MGQVPRYTIIGAGRVARHMCHYLRLLDIPFQQWSRALSQVQLQQALEHSTHVLVLISDAAIEPFIQAHPELSNKTLVHFSGALHTPLAYSAHPLMTFTESLYDLAHYQRMPFVTERNDPSLEKLLPGLSNPSYSIDAEQKALYHALCVTSGNFTTLLWQHCMQLFEQQLNLPEEILLPYLQQITSNIASNPQGALTGPIARGDHITMQRNLAALENTPLHPIYKSFIDTFAQQPTKELCDEHS